MITKTLTIILAALFFFAMQTPFLAEQKRFERVRTAIEEKEEFIEKKLREHQLAIEDFHLLFVACKDDDVLEVYAKSKRNMTYRKIQSYKVCSRSGELGPKRKAGDKQVPEGFYHIDRFNPKSNFYLSLGVNYPNASDKIKSTASDLGGDIFIHGSCVTIGCLPMTDDVIKEIYLLAVHAKSNGQTKIPVYIFPYAMTDENHAAHKRKYRSNKALLHFWDNLKKGYDKFVIDKTTLKFDVAENGDYLF